MRSSARVTARLRNGSTVLEELRSGPPLSIRPVRCDDGAAVALVGSAAAPVGGDELAVSVCVGPGAHLRVEAIAATMVWPSADGARSRQTLTIAVAAGACLEWIGQPTLPVEGSDHLQEVSIQLAADAQLDYVEELALGRTGEGPGRLDARLRVERDGTVLLDHRQVIDPDGLGWETSAAMGRHRHVIQQLVVGSRATGRPASIVEESDAAAATMPLAPDALLSLSTGVTRLTALGAAASLQAKT